MLQILRYCPVPLLQGLQPGEHTRFRPDRGLAFLGGSQDAAVRVESRFGAVILDELIVYAGRDSLDAALGSNVKTCELVPGSETVDCTSQVIPFAGARPDITVPSFPTRVRAGRRREPRSTG